MLTGNDFKNAKFVQFLSKQPIREEEGTYGKSYIYSIQCEGHDELKATDALHGKLQAALANTNTLSMHLAAYTTPEGEARKAWNLNPATAGSVSQSAPEAPSQTKLPQTDKDQSIARAVALKAACEVGKGSTPDDYTLWADEFLSWLTKE